jgi:hypothetical protein
MDIDITAPPALKTGGADPVKHGRGEFLPAVRVVGTYPFDWSI